MRLDKSHRIAIVIVLIAAFLVAENLLQGPTAAFSYSGIQIYDAIRDFRTLDSRGFEASATVVGKASGTPIVLKGAVVDTYPGWFIVDSEGMSRIVEGPMGSNDVLADAISFEVSPRISVEAVYRPERSSAFRLRTGFRKVRGSIAFDNARMTPTLLQEIRNLNQELYSLSSGRVDVMTLGSGFILDIKSPLPVAQVARLVSGIGSDSVQTGYMYYYSGADDEKEIPNVRSQLEASGAILVNYYKQR